MEELVTSEFIESHAKNFPWRLPPYAVFLLIGAYLLFIFVVGPQFMKNRRAFKLKKVLIAYNFIQVIWCAIILIRVFGIVLEIDYTCKKPPTVYQFLMIFDHGFQYFLMKVLDLMDTVFFVLRKKKNQITHLHVYHHVGMVFGSYYVFHYTPGTQLVYVGAINIFVHFLMYGYYLLTAYVKDHQSIIWWKKHITQIQILQFICNLGIYGQMFFRENCGMPMHLYFLIFSQDIYMLVLFGKFYYHAYIKKKPEKSK